MMKKPFSRVGWILGSVVYALFFALGAQIDSAHACTLPGTLIRFLPALAAALLILRLILSGLDRLPALRPAERRLPLLLCQGVILFCWLPMFLTHYPGSFVYDTIQEMHQVASGHYTVFHPVLHMLFMRLCMSLIGITGSFEKCLAICTLLQMLLLSLLFALCCASLSRTAGRRAELAACAFFALYPVHMAMSVNFVKDTLFSGFFALYVTLLLEEAEVPLPLRRRCLLLLSGILACQLRNNMIYAAAVFCLFLLLIRPVRRLFPMALGVVLLSLGMQAGIRMAVHAAPGNTREMLSVPAQQLSLAYREHPEAFSEEDTAMLDSLFPTKSYLLYTEDIADPVKDQLDDAWFSAHRGEAAALWLRIGLRCPGSYISAFLRLMLPAYYPYASWHFTADWLEVGFDGLALTQGYGIEPLQQTHRFEDIRAWLKDNLWKNGASGIPVLRLLFNTGVLFWLCGLCLVLAACRGNLRCSGVLLLPFLLWGTYLLGPVMQGRYAYPFVCALPAMLAAVLRKTDDSGC